MLFAAIAGTSILLAIALSSYLTRPVHRLADRARALGRGEPLGHLDIRTGDELEQLARAFTDMAAALEQRQAEVSRSAARLQVLSEASRAFAEATLEYDALLRTIAERVVDVTGDACTIRRLSHDGQLLEPVAGHHPDPHLREALWALMRQTAQRADSGNWQPVIEEGRTIRLAVTAENIPPDASEAQAEFMRRHPMRALMLAPLQARGRVIGGISLTRYGDGSAYTEDDEALLRDLADRAALAIDNAELYREERRARGEAEAERQRLAFLAEASRALAGSLDYETTLDTVVGLAIPTFADWCVVDLVDAAGSIERAAAAHADPVLAPTLRDLWKGRSLDVASAHPTAEVVRSGRPHFLPDVPDDFADRVAQDPEHREFLRRLRSRSRIAVPLTARGSVLGVLAVAFTDSGRRYGPEDLVLIEELGRRAAVAIDNASLYRSVREHLAEREQAEAVLRESEERFRATFEQAAVGIAHVALDGRWLRVNARFCEIVGYSREELPGLTFQDITHPDDLAADEAQARQLLTGAIRTYSMDKRYLRKDGSVIWVTLTGSLVRAPSGEPSYFIAVVEDITERQRAEEALRVKNEELVAMTQQLWQAGRLATMGELAASIAHELNNPLGTVTLRVEALLAQTPENDPRRRALEIVDQEVERMAALVANLLQFGRRGEPQISTLDLSEEVDRTVELMHYHLRNRRVVVAREFAPDVPHVQADRQQLRQVLLNLFTNAADAMPDGGTLTIRVRPERSDGGARRVVVEVADTGQGIPDDVLPRVAEPFFTTKPEGKGTGLGLALCRRIVEEHHGALEIESIVGAGTTVRISLPVANGANARSTCWST